MKITAENIKKIIADGKTMSMPVKMTDIGYVLLLERIEDKYVAYSILNGVGNSNEDIDSYDGSEKIKSLKRYIKGNFSDKKNESNEIKKGADDNKLSKVNGKYTLMTFEENKEALINLLSKIQELAESGEIPKKDAVKLETDIRTKLNDKFQVSEQVDEKRVVVNSKYNDICPYCEHEIRRKTDEDMLAEIKEQYILTPKQPYKDNGYE